MTHVIYLTRLKGATETVGDLLSLSRYQMVTFFALFIQFISNARQSTFQSLLPRAA